MKSARKATPRNAFSQNVDDPAADGTDVLGRGRLAERILQVVRSYDVSWNLRLGILGGWGAGKTTLLRFIRAKANPDEVVVNLRVWQYNTRDAIWRGLVRSILDATEQMEVEQEISAEYAKLRGKLERYSSEVPALVAKASRFHKVAEVVFDIGSQYYAKFSQVSNDDLSRLSSILGGKRFLVLVDDLDRIEPSQQVEILHTLKEVLSIHGFVFILAFDHDIVSASIKQANQAWGAGGEYLEKILNFRFWLPPVNAKDKTALLSEAAARLGDPFTLEAFLPLQSYFSSNPRELKAQVRAFTAIKSELSRFGHADIPWRLLILGHLLSTEVPEFSKIVLENWEKLAYGHVAEKHLNLDPKQKESSLEKDVVELFPILNSWEASKRNWALSIFDAIFAESIPPSDDEFRLWTNLLVEPPLLTKSEFVTLEASNTLEPWILEENKQLRFEAAVRLTIDYRLAMLRAATEPHQQSDKLKCHGRVRAMTALLRSLLIDFPSRNPEVAVSKQQFEMAMEMYGLWNHFRSTPEDRELREAELKLLDSLALHMPVSALDKLQPLVLSGHTLSTRAVLRNDMEQVVLRLRKLILPEAYGEFVNAFDTSDYLRDLEPEGVKVFMLFQKESPLYDVKQSTAFISRLQRAPIPLQRIDNALQFVFILHIALTKHVGFVHNRPEELIPMNPELIRAFWRTALHNPLSFRTYGSLKDVRNAFEKHLGGKLEVPDWWDNYEAIPVNA